MRLIDADKILKETDGMEENLIDEKDKQSVRYLRIEMKSAPTVNAIPIRVIDDIKEEIKSKASEHVKFADNGRRENGLYEALDIIDKHIGGNADE